MAIEGDGTNIYVLVDTGTIYPFDSTGSLGTSISPPATATYVDMDIDSNGDIWVVDDTGQTYKYSGGSWTTLGTSGDTSVVAIGVDEIPELSDALAILAVIPFIAIIVRRKRNTREQKSI